MQQIDVSELQDLVATLGGSPPAMLSNPSACYNNNS